MNWKQQYESSAVEANEANNTEGYLLNYYQIEGLIICFCQVAGGILRK